MTRENDPHVGQGNTDASHKQVEQKQQKDDSAQRQAIYRSLIFHLTYDNNVKFPTSIQAEECLSGHATHNRDERPTPQNNGSYWYRRHKLRPAERLSWPHSRHTRPSVRTKKPDGRHIYKAKRRLVPPYRAPAQTISSTNPRSHHWQKRSFLPRLEWAGP